MSDSPHDVGSIRIMRVPAVADACRSEPDRVIERTIASPIV
jgi:hypothetical protein